MVIVLCCVCSVVNSCPASPRSLDSKSHLPSFDIMAQYASKLLSVKHNDGCVLSDSEVSSGWQMPVSIACIICGMSHRCLEEASNKGLKKRRKMC